MENKPLITKNYVEIICPHCSEKVIVSIRSMQPAIDWALKKESTEEMKARLIASIEELSMEEEKKQQLIASIRDEEFVVGPEDVELILAQIKKELEVAE